MIKGFTFATLIGVIVLMMVTGASKADKMDELFENYLWKNRVVLVFGPRNDNAQYVEQIEILENAKAEMEERDIVEWRFVYLESVQLDGQFKVHLSTNPFYDRFDVGLSEFAFILIGKDGEIKLRSNDVVTPEDLFPLIDAMPMRKREMEK